MFNLLVSTWSLAMTGSVVAIVGGMSIMGVVTTALEGTRGDGRQSEQRVGVAAQRQGSADVRKVCADLRALAETKRNLRRLGSRREALAGAGAGGLSTADFITYVSEARLGLDRERASRLFALSDVGGRGTLGLREVERLAELLEMVMSMSGKDSGGDGVGGGGGEGGGDGAHLNALARSEERVQQRLREVEAHFDEKLHAMIPEIAAAVVTALHGQQAALAASKLRARVEGLPAVQKARPPRLQRAGASVSGDACSSSASVMTAASADVTRGIHDAPDARDELNA